MVKIISKMHAVCIKKQVFQDAKSLWGFATGDKKITEGWIKENSGYLERSAKKFNITDPVESFEFDNDPTVGFSIQLGVNNTDRSSTYRIIDPRGFCVWLNSGNFIMLMNHCTIKEGVIVEGGCVWAFDRSGSLCLIPINSNEYKESSSKVKIKSLKEGDVVKFADSSTEHIFIGRGIIDYNVSFYSKNQNEKSITKTYQDSERFYFVRKREFEQGTIIKISDVKTQVSGEVCLLGKVNHADIMSYRDTIVIDFLGTTVTTWQLPNKIRNSYSDEIENLNKVKLGAKWVVGDIKYSNLDWGLLRKLKELMKGVK